MYIFMSSFTQIMFLRLCAFISSLSFCIAELYSTRQIDYCLFIHSLVSGNLDCFQCLAIMTKMAIIIFSKSFCAHVFLFFSSKYLEFSISGS